MEATLPTVQEIAERYEARREGDMLGFETDMYIVYLPFEQAKPFLIATAKAEEWEAESLTHEAIFKKMHDYMEFAWEKANGQRGISSSRSIAHYVAWTWLAGDRELSASLQKGEDYAPYGKPMLRRICEHYGWDHKQWSER